MDVMNFKRVFHVRGELLDHFGASFIALIAQKKKKGVESIKDFCLISLVGSIYKVLAMVVWLQISKELILITQGAFVLGGKSLMMF